LKYNGINWVEEASFSGSGDDWFGTSISLSGDGKTVAIVTAWSDGGRHSGHVKVYHQTDGGTWKPKGRKLVGLNSRDWFGSSVSLSKNGNQLVIGAPESDLEGDWSGYIIVYEFNVNYWIQKGDTIAGEAADDEFGNAVSLSADGNIVAGAAPVSDEWSGSVRVFCYNNKRRATTNIDPLRNMQTTQQGEQWIQIGQTLIGQTPGDWFGQSLSINANGDTIAIGTWGRNVISFQR